MAHASQLTRYRGAVLGITGIACGLGIYLVYSTYYLPPDKGTLHRSNAVHRPRVDRSQQPKMEVTVPNNEAPLGTLIIRRGQHVVVTNLAFDQLPTLEAITAALGSVPNGTIREVRQCAVYGALLNCFRAPELRERLIGTVFEPLPAAMDLRNIESIRRAREVLALHIPDLDEELVDRAMETVLGDRLREDFGSSSSYATGTSIAETEDLEGLNGAPREPSQGLKGLLYHIAEEDAKRKAYEHRGISCEECGEAPIRGIRWHCLNCPDFDLCSTCESQTVHQKTHVLAKIKIPLPVLSQPSQQYPLWYPGDPRKMHSPLDAIVKKRLAQAYTFEEPNIDALYDQFTCIANAPWLGDPAKVQAAIDIRAFKRALTPERWFSRLAPNAMYDRMFAFYDADNNGLIGFEEFVSGIAYLRGPKRLASIRRALAGFDIDKDGFVDRSDFLRMFKAKYSVQQHLVTDMVEGHEAEQTMAAMDVLRSSQPISSIFCQEDIPQGELRPRNGKQMDAFGDMQPLPGAKTILEDNDPWLRAADSKANGLVSSVALEGASRERLRHHLSRFAEMLYGSSDVHPAQGEEAAEDDQVAAPDQSPAGDDNKGAAAADEAASTVVSQDALLQVVEDGLSEMLDPMFGAREQMDRNAIRTRNERQQWRKQIEEVVREKQAFQDELRTAAMVDPLMATAMESYTDVKVERKRENVQEPPFKAEIVPTDSDSLARREAEIADKPLQELLEATGYGIVDEDVKNKPSTGLEQTSLAQTLGHRTMSIVEPPNGATSNPCSQDKPADPTMPQHKPNAEQPSASSQVTQGKVSGMIQQSRPPPTRQRLEYLASLDEVEREIEDRGGPGRLSFDEVEGMVRADTTKELRGLVVSWLEFASF